MDIELINKVKRTAMIALVSDDDLMDRLVLKGGNAINIIYNLSSRASIDLDFSINDEFKEDEIIILKEKIKDLLTAEFKKEKLILFDYKFQIRPEKIDKAVKSFWGGYLIEFKLSTESIFRIRKENIGDLRRTAKILGKNNSTKYMIDISKYEFCKQKKTADIDGYTIYVYTPEMIVIEKLRAICQQVDDYKYIIKSRSQRSRARDFYDIAILTQHFSIDLTTKENTELLKAIFDAKKVPYKFLGMIKDYKELHAIEFPSLLDTIIHKENIKDFDYYFYYTVDLAKIMLEVLRIK